MSSLLLVAILQQAGRSAVMDDCESKVGSELWLSRHLAGKGEEDGRRKLSEVAGMLGSMLQRGVFATALGKRKGRLHSAMMFRERERLSRFMHRSGGGARGPSVEPPAVREHLVLARGIWVGGPWIAIMRSVVTHLLP